MRVYFECDMRVSPSDPVEVFQVKNTYDDTASEAEIEGDFSRWEREMATTAMIPGTGRWRKE